ncbi:hypothetical protein ABZO31_20685 [Streptomyces sp. HUAS MG47]|uniref:hypothetical protein n=1 Tax=Streptomyces solicamelliae TaxID=3231716 RepID=UPI003877F855
MSRTTAISGDRTGRGGAVRAFFRSWVGDFERAPSAEKVEDGLISGVQITRTLLGLAAAVWLIASYPLSDGGQEFVLTKLLELGLACGILAVGSIVGVTAFLVASTPDRRRDFAERLRRPISAALMLLWGPLCAWLSFMTVTGDLVDGTDLKEFFTAITGPGWISSVLAFLVLIVGWLVAAVLLLGSIPYTLLITWLSVLTCFRTMDVHPLLPPLLSPLLVWSLFAFQLYSGPDVAAPPVVLYSFMLGGPLSVTALSVWEVRRLRTLHGITLRSALGR